MYTPSQLEDFPFFPCFVPLYQIYFWHEGCAVSIQWPQNLHCFYTVISINGFRHLPNTSCISHQIGFRLWKSCHQNCWFPFFFPFLFLKSNIITWCKICFKAFLDGDINLQDNVQPVNTSVRSLRLSVVERPTRISLSSSGCRSSLALCVAAWPCSTFCFIMYGSIRVGHRPFSFVFFFSI